MDVRYINPFIDAVRSVFSTMVHLDVELGHPLRAGRYLAVSVSD